MKIQYFLVLVGFVCFMGCKSHNPCSNSVGRYKLKVNEVPKKNNGFYHLCYLEEEPQVIIMDSLIRSSFPEYLYKENAEYIVIKLKVKPVDIYFSKYSRDDALGLWVARCIGSLEAGVDYEDPSKKAFLRFNTFYYITCNASDLKGLKKLYKRKSLVLVDHKLPEVQSDYLFSLNAYPSHKVDYSKLYSFDEVFAEYLERKTQLELKYRK